MTTAQDEALDKAHILLGEHFDNVVILADGSDQEFPQNDGGTLFSRHKGTTWACLGLMKVYTALTMEKFLDDQND